MGFKKIWNALTSDLREDLWNELTDKQKVSIVNDHPQPQLDRFYEKLTPVLTDQADKWGAEWERIWKIAKKIGREGKRGIPKYLNSNIEKPETEEQEKSELFASWKKIFDFYYASWGHVLIFKKSVDLTPQKIIDLELKYFWKDNESLEKQKKDWDIRFGKLISLDDPTDENNSSNENLFGPGTATATDIAWEFRDRFLLGFDENEQEHNS